MKTELCCVFIKALSAKQAQGLLSMEWLVKCTVKANIPHKLTHVLSCTQQVPTEQHTYSMLYATGYTVHDQITSHDPQRWEHLPFREIRTFRSCVLKTKERLKQDLHSFLKIIFNIFFQRIMTDDVLAITTTYK